MKQWLIFLGFYLWLVPLGAQEAVDTFELEAAEIVAYRLQKFGLGQRVQQFDQAELERNRQGALEDLLAGNSGVFIKSYGAGSLASPASRGTGYGHTAVLWNGFNLQSPLNGGIDFSLLPTALNDAVSLQYGGSSALFGSGAIGGTIHLEQKARLKPGLHGEIALDAGSFHQLGQQIRASWGGKKWSTDFRLLHESTQNDFPIGDENKNLRQTNAALNQWAATQHNRVQLSKEQVLYTWIWLQSTDREIPPSLTQSNVHATQQDTSLRFAAEWQRYGKSNIQKARAAWLDERFVYSSDLIEASFTRSKSFITELENEYLLSNTQSLLIGGHYTFEQGIAEGIFTDQPQRHRLAAFLSYRRLLARWQLVANMRQEWIISTVAPFTASIGLHSPSWSGWHLEGNISRNYKLPTFNDLYWSDAGAQGNEDLGAERSWNQEASVVYEGTLQKIKWASRWSVYNLQVKDWILWAPNASQIWQPDNLRRVWSRGVEWSGNGQWKSGQWTINTRLAYQWNRATNQVVYAGATKILGKQLIHQPMHSGNVQLGAQYQNTRLWYRHQLTGKRFSTSDNLESIKGFHLGDLSLQQQIKWSKITFQIQCRITNIWNANYEVLAFRPMPGRAGWLGVRVEI